MGLELDLQGSLTIMTENQSLFQNERLDSKSGPDLLSGLPLSIIHIILAFVPIRNAVKTIILSRQWRYTRASLPHLVFDKRCANTKNELIYCYEECIKFFVNNALLNHKGPIHKFQMSCAFQKRCLNEWMRSLSRILPLSKIDIRDLLLDIECDDHTNYWWKMHASMCSFGKLTSLELSHCKLDPPPSTFKGILVLEYLGIGIQLYHDTLVLHYLKDIELDELNFEDIKEITAIAHLIIGAPNLHRGLKSI